MRRMTVTLTLLLGSAYAQQATTTTRATQTLLYAINNAQKTITIYSPWFRNQKVANALRAGMVDRGLQVNLIIIPENLRDPGGYNMSTALAGGNLYTAAIANYETAEAFMLVDGKTLYLTRHLYFPEEAAQNSKVTVVTNSKAINTVKAWTSNAIKGKKPLPPKYIAYLLALDHHLSTIQQSNPELLKK